MPIQYPQTKKVDQVDVYHGTKVEDPYRWTEDLFSDETTAWVGAQNDLAREHLSKLPLQNEFKERLTQLWNYERYGLPVKEGGRYFVSHNDGLQAQPQLYVFDSLDSEPRLLLDPNTWSEDGTVALQSTAASRDGRYLAYARSDGGSDFQEILVLDLETGAPLDDHLRWSKYFPPTWDREGNGFFYTGYGIPASGEFSPEELTYFMKVFYHRLGTPQESDRLVYERPDNRELFLHPQVSDDGRYLVISANPGSEMKTSLYYLDLDDPASEIVALVDGFDALYSYVGNDGQVFWVTTNLDAPLGKLVEVDSRSPERSSWKEIVPESEQMLQSVSLVGGRLIANYLKDACSRIARFDLDGTHRGDVELPGIGSVGGFGGDSTDPETFFVFHSYTHAPTVYRYDVATGTSTVWKRPTVDFDPDAFDVTQVFYESKDGTRIPMFIVLRKGTELDGSSPLYLTGYGGFGIPTTPMFSPAYLAWIEQGGILAIPNLRGGGEYGEEWHRAGMLHNKQNVFDDFIAAAEWLIANRYTSSQHLAIGGGSNGGLLVGACVTQRPELFAAVHCSVGVLDMLRFDEFTIGWAWAREYGYKADPDDFEALYAYSPLHNVRAGTTYPPILVTTADHDDRVWPFHSFKFAAALQEAQAGEDPILLRVTSRAGHGLGKPMWLMIEELAESWAFLAAHTK